MLDQQTIAFADFGSNRQDVSTGNLSEHPHALLFRMDDARRRRIKIRGAARLSADPALVARLRSAGYRARVGQAIILTVTAWDVNCPQSILPKIAAADVAAAPALRDARLAAVDVELVQRRG